MDNIKNKNLYKKVKNDADIRFKSPTSAYKSMWIQKRYQELGGKYTTNKKNNKLKRWRDEKWIQVIPYLTKGQIVECGSSNKSNKVCRPLKRVNKDSPITIGELLKIHSKKKLLELENKKLRNMNGRLYWKLGKLVV